ncbi:Endonuclease/exonuclease/phosphatase [Dipodascopsis tothii]|uniref:Endonuclease/exonuclease/phosphatase n=1 Tax=Dipodascopsis tothii TaxID=44089 RepID=UPI0034CFF2FD
MADDSIADTSFPSVDSIRSRYERLLASPGPDDDGPATPQPHDGQDGPPPPPKPRAIAAAPVPATPGRVPSQSASLRPELPPPRKSVSPAPVPTRPPRPPPPPRGPDDDRDGHALELPPRPPMAGYPDSSRANRRPPHAKGLVKEIVTGPDASAKGRHDSASIHGRAVIVSGEHMVVAGGIGACGVWSVVSGRAHGYVAFPPDAGGGALAITSIAFKAALALEDEGTVAWLGARDGTLYEVDLARLRVVAKRSNAHSAAIRGIYRCGCAMWTLDDDGKLQVWLPTAGAGEPLLPRLTDQPHTHRLAHAPQYALVVGDELWVGRNRQVAVYRPAGVGAAEAAFLVSGGLPALRAVGEITSATTIPSLADLVFFGHDDGQVSVYSRRQRACVDVVNISLYKITRMEGVGSLLWVVFKTGMVFVYDVRQSPWLVLKDWNAHRDRPIVDIAVDRAAIWKLGGLLPVATLDADRTARLWDGLLRADWLETDMQEHDEEYCDFRNVRTLVCTWNVGAARPGDLNRDAHDAAFVETVLRATEPPPDVVVFGLQEIVELDNTTVTAKSVFKNKKDRGQHKSSAQSSAVGVQWQDLLAYVAGKVLPERYHVLHTDVLVGLYTCVLVRDGLRPAVHSLQSSAVKTGLGGFHGNKGALITRFAIDDTSLCFVNCHLAAGQSSVIHRNNDIAAILESKIPAPTSYGDGADSLLYVAGGDGSMVLDHEICFVSGDMNYRINMPRIPVTKLIAGATTPAARADALAKLQAADQLLTQLNRNPGFRLRPFVESPIDFWPTYKYDVGRDTYDSSEKKRVPAWCDRIFYRAGASTAAATAAATATAARISDHRPVYGVYDVKVKTVDGKLRKRAYERSLGRWDEFVAASIEQARVHFLENEMRT